MNPRRSSTQRPALLLALALATACRSTGSTPPLQPAPTSPPSPSSSQAVSNRDRHGDPNVAKYIERLVDEARVADLQIDLVIERLALRDDAVVGDLGCGPGLFSLAFARACPSGIVYASDIEPAQLDQVREKIRGQGVRNIVPVLASLDDPHFPPGRLDLVFIADTYHHLEDRVAYLQRLRSVLKPSGRLVLLEYKPGQIPVGPPPEHKLAAGVMERELDQAGYVRIERLATHRWHDFEIWRVRQPE